MKILLNELTATPWHTRELKEIAEKLQTNTSAGLSEKEAQNRLEEIGLNELEEKKGRSPFKIFISQFNDFMIWILIAAALISGVIIREITDAIVILVILIINSVLGFIQENRAEKALQALKELAAPTAQAVRNNTESQISAKLLVPGDIIKLTAGDLVPADCRIITETNLQADEAILTGESLPVEKTTVTLKRENMPVGDRINMLFSGTNIVKGRCSAVVIATGKYSEIGKIASLVQEKEEQTPLQKELKTVGARIGIICLIVSVVVFAAGILKGFLAISQGILNTTRADVISEMLLVSVALAVASIPEGLPAIVTISLALGVQKMAKNNAIVRRLSAVEALGSVSVICTDKTGTLTQNKMIVRKIYNGLEENLHYEELLKKQLENKMPSHANTEDFNQEIAFKFLLENAVLCNDAYYTSKTDSKLIGDPTETALIELGNLCSLEKSSLEFMLPRKFEEPFDSNRKMMSTVHEITEDYFFPGNIKDIQDHLSENNKTSQAPKYLIFSKGAPEVITEKCTRIIKNNSIVPITDKDKKKIEEINTRLANEAMRNLAFAFKYLTEIPDGKKIEQLENELIFSGIMGMIDPPRPEVYDAVQKCKNANINIIMVTGDHKLTAKAIGSELGILNAGDRIIDEEEFAAYSKEKLTRDIEQIKVFARVSPEHKVEIVDALKANDHIVAMTGDGINDAPSLKKADIGLAMGITGTDVSKEASDIILTDDNFATIVQAIKEGRVIYDNLKKFILFLLSCNISEVLLMFIAIVFGSFLFRLIGVDPLLAYLPLLPVQILWMNLITDGLPALALGVNPAEPDIMERKATKRRERILSKNRLWQIIWQGLILTLGALFMYFIGPKLFSTHSLAHNTDIFHTCVFTTLVITQLFHSLNFRFEDRGIFARGIFANKFLNISIIFSMLLQLAIIYIPFLQRIFSTASLNLNHWLFILISSIVPVILINAVNEIRYFKKRHKRCV